MEERIISQLGRKPQGSFVIDKFCPWGYPMVIKNHPHEGSILPTLYWLTCPYIVKIVSRMEAKGLVGEYDNRLIEDQEFRLALEKAHKSYAFERSKLIDRDAKLPKGIIDRLLNSGIGGSENKEGVKCLHMHLAHFLATGKNPIGKEVWQEILAWEADDCPSNCPSIPPLKKRPKAIIDAGSNTCRLLILGGFLQPLQIPIYYQEKNNYWQAIYQETITTEAGRDLELGRKKTIEAVERYLEIINKNGAELVAAVATGIWRQVGAPLDLLKVISGKKEAQLSFAGVCRSLSLKDEVTVVDLGGGSLEIASGKVGSLSSLETFDLGFWTVGKKLQLSYPPSRTQLALVQDYVRSKIKSLEIKGKIVMIGGTATTLAGLALGLKEYDPQKIHGYTLDLNGCIPKNLPVWAKDRESSIAIGYEILKAVASIANTNTAIISDIGLMGGLFS
ncbi:MAG TPA: DUF501 domain-containing protein [Firmicutes bacterium]|nr:DUF501 domain-containing protein [Bacillota bacterium]